MEGARIVPLVIPVNSWEEAEAALRNLGNNPDGILGQVKELMSGDLVDPNETLEELRRENTILKAKLEGVQNALGLEL